MRFSSMLSGDLAEVDEHVAYLASSKVALSRSRLLQSVGLRGGANHKA